MWNQHGVYALYQEFKLVYVGMAALSQSNIGSRLQAHNEKPRMQKRWDSFSWFAVDSLDGAGTSIDPEKTGAGLSPALIARTLELVVILVADPPMNRSQGRFKGSQQIIQALPRQVEKSMTEKLEEIKQLLLQIERRAK